MCSHKRSKVKNRTRATMCAATRETVVRQHIPHSLLPLSSEEEENSSESDEEDEECRLFKLEWGDFFVFLFRVLGCEFVFPPPPPRFPADPAVLEFDFSFFALEEEDFFSLSSFFFDPLSGFDKVLLFFSDLLDLPFFSFLSFLPTVSILELQRKLSVIFKVLFVLISI